MTFRVKAITPIPMNEEGLKHRRAQIPDELIRKGYEVDFVSVKNGPMYADSMYDALLMDAFVFEAGIDSEKEGYDAVILDTVSDSAMYPLRSRLTIPVVGAGQSAFHFACTLGDKFSIISLWDRWFHFYEQSMYEYGLWPKCASMRAIDFKPDTVGLMGGKEDKLFPQLEELALQCIEEDNADVICLASTTMHEAWGYLSEKLPVPVVNPGLTAFMFAQIFLELGLTHSKHAFPPPLAPIDDVFHSLLADKPNK